jgi:signal transduction histidine kinase
MTARRFATDAAVTVVLALATVAFVRVPEGGCMYLCAGSARDIEKFGGQAAWDSLLTWWWTASAVGSAAMLVRSRLPLLALGATVAMATVHAMLPNIPLMPIDAAALVALYTVAAASSPRWLSYGALGATVVAAFMPQLLQSGRLPELGWVGVGAVMPGAAVIAWLLGDRTRVSREQAAQRARDLERERDQQAEIATAAERARIARDLHDAVAHGLSIIVIQAQAASGALDKRSTDGRTTARTALDAIEETGRDSLAEMRRLLGLSRADQAGLAPLPGPADLPALVDRVRATGLPVDLTVSGDLTRLPTGVGLSAYRIVQEALTNTLKHAGPDATAAVDVRCASDAVELTVTDTGAGASFDLSNGGSGLHGMRERVGLLGGTLAAGNGPAGGFRVAARLPLVEL